MWAWPNACDTTGRLLYRYLPLSWYQSLEEIWACSSEANSSASVLSALPACLLKGYELSTAKPACRYLGTTLHVSAYVLNGWCMSSLPHGHLKFILVWFIVLPYAIDLRCLQDYCLSIAAPAHRPKYSMRRGGASGHNLQVSVSPNNAAAVHSTFENCCSLSSLSLSLLC